MATSLVIEEESGTCTGYVHPHNGYYAGDFSRTVATVFELNATVLPLHREVVDAPVRHRTAA
jgi:hypothetical protein